MSTTITKERPIIFSAPMVRALLDGRKTQTRRIVRDMNPTFAATNPSPAVIANALRCPYGAPGERLWVRETWGNGWTTRPQQGEKLVYRASPLEPQGFQCCHLWRSPIHMPRWASRITLEITDVRVQRVNEITPADAMAEGCPDDLGGEYCVDGMDGRVVWFMDLWNKINGDGAWARNSFVWAITFTRPR